MESVNNEMTSTQSSVEQAEAAKLAAQIAAELAGFEAENDDEEDLPQEVADTASSLLTGDLMDSAMAKYVTENSEYDILCDALHKKGGDALVNLVHKLTAEQDDISKFVGMMTSVLNKHVSIHNQLSMHITNNVYQHKYPDIDINMAHYYKTDKVRVQSITLLNFVLNEPSLITALRTNSIQLSAASSLSKLPDLVACAEADLQEEKPIVLSASKGLQISLVGIYSHVIRVGKGSGSSVGKENTISELYFRKLFNDVKLHLNIKFPPYATYIKFADACFAQMKTVSPEARVHVSSVGVAPSQPLIDVFLNQGFIELQCQKIAPDIYAVS